ncbi:MAG: Lrp/AsnC family transcriptional regulator [Ornithinimicrobium sp.]|uniref:Lrp/AsnC family transcriptional regulator n=1 Tax=Ornithinimicrobium sp. TaxID=1977084 RepID=UPI0026E0642B|nr:Lrp/AsnC family transcriptional regulator [Ornithinimicrobium sp.]MDO5738523.1 Lrp/AsnC family transcriptional regulator [Ornithinimicrobium sp.]
MQGLDDIDRLLVARLRDDGRASVSSLAEDLHVARGTAQNRLNRLVSEGVIRRFTVELAPEHEKQTVRAVTTIQLHSTTTQGVVRTLRTIPEVAELHATNGSWDLVAELRAATLEDLDRALVDLRSVRGVVNTETSILLRTL